MIRESANHWNYWRAVNWGKYIDMSGKNLSNTNLSNKNLININFSNAQLKNCDFTGSNLWTVKFDDAQLDGAIFHKADLAGVKFTKTILRMVDFRSADLSYAEIKDGLLDNIDFSNANLSNFNMTGSAIENSSFIRADLRGANLTSAHFIKSEFNETKMVGTVFSRTIMTNCKITNTNLNKCGYYGQSFVDLHTVQNSDTFPIGFLRGIGLNDSLVDYIPPLQTRGVQMYSCFISYSSKNGDFANKLHGDLQNAGVRCWFAPHDLRIGDKTWDTIDEAIRLREKVLLILSKESLSSEWVEDEVSKGFAEERARNATVLFPIRLDDEIMITTEPWACKLRDQRHVGYFRDWKHHDAYQANFARLLRDLQIKST